MKRAYMDTELVEKFGAGYPWYVTTQDANGVCTPIH